MHNPEFAILCIFLFRRTTKWKWKKRKDGQILGPCQRIYKATEHVGEGKTNCSLCSWNGPQGFGEVTRGMENQW